jgi:YesN/AraC family two-component response regulator
MSTEIEEALAQVIRQLERQDEVNKALEQWCQLTERRLNELERQAGNVVHV